MVENSSHFAKIMQFDHSYNSTLKLKWVNCDIRLRLVSQSRNFRLTFCAVTQMVMQLFYNDTYICDSMPVFSGYTDVKIEYNPNILALLIILASFRGSKTQYLEHFIQNTTERK